MEMELNLSNHTQKKSRRLGFTPMSIEIILQFARMRHMGSGSQEYFLGEKENDLQVLIFSAPSTLLYRQRCTNRAYSLSE